MHRSDNRKLTDYETYSFALLVSEPLHFSTGKVASFAKASA